MTRASELIADLNVEQKKTLLDLIDKIQAESGASASSRTFDLETLIERVRKAKPKRPRKRAARVRRLTRDERDRIAAGAYGLMCEDSDLSHEEALAEAHRRYRLFPAQRLFSRRYEPRIPRVRFDREGDATPTRPDVPPTDVAPATPPQSDTAQPPPIIKPVAEHLRERADGWCPWVLVNIGGVRR